MDEYFTPFRVLYGMELNGNFTKTPKYAVI